METLIDIKPYILVRAFGVKWYQYLHIVGGSGNHKGKPERCLNGGEYNFCLFYASPDEMKGLSDPKCVMFWCKENFIPFGLGDTIEEAYNNYILKTKHNGK